MTMEACIACHGTAQRVSRRVLMPAPSDVLQCLDCGLQWRSDLLQEIEGRGTIGRQLYSDFEAVEDRVALARQGLWGNMFPRLSAYKKTGKLLDVGCGRGHFLAAAKSFGWDGEGVDPSLEDTRYAAEKLGVRVRRGVFEAAQFPAGAYDVITLWNVLDDLVDPAGALAGIRRLLRPGGLLAMRLPNAPLHLWLHRMCRWAGTRDVSVFVNYSFNLKSLGLLLEAAGFVRYRFCNGIPSAGDPYGLFGLSGKAVNAGKRLAFLLSQALYHASLQRVVLSPSYLAFANKD